jgi:hypothetical protein
MMLRNQSFSTISAAGDGFHAVKNYKFPVLALSKLRGNWKYRESSQKGRSLAVVVEDSATRS